MSTANYSNLAIQYAERYGIIQYRVVKNMLIYNVSYPAYLSNPRYTIQHSVDLNTMKDTTKQLKRYDAKGVYNR